MPGESEESCEEGYGYELVSAPFDDFTCLICHLIAREAQQSTCCGNTFCRQCIEKWTEDDDNCPVCREVTDLKPMHVTDRKAIRKINQLKVYCKNTKEGCTWDGQIRDAEAHLESCPYHLVRCPN